MNIRKYSHANAENLVDYFKNAFGLKDNAVRFHMQHDAGYSGN